MNDAFISYRRDCGYAVAQLIRGGLKEQGIYCYLDLEEDRSGHFDESILNAIKDSENFILILTKGTLERCINEGDWVRREIAEAVSLGKKIIPILYPDFEWPKELNEKFPKEILLLENLQGVVLSKEYLPATITKIISYMSNVKRGGNTKLYSAISETSEFFANGFVKLPDIQCVDMAFHGGSEWRRNSNKVDILSHIIDKSISLRILVNSSDIVSNVCAHMSQPLKKYVSFDSCVEEWLELAQKYPDVVQVRVADVPLLHRLYIIRGEEKGYVNVKYYTYGNYTPDKDFRMVFDDFETEYKLYTKEFEYIWENASHSIV